MSIVPTAALGLTSAVAFSAWRHARCANLERADARVLDSADAPRIARWARCAATEGLMYRTLSPAVALRMRTMGLLDDSGLACAGSGAYMRAWDPPQARSALMWAPVYIAAALVAARGMGLTGSTLACLAVAAAQADLAFREIPLPLVTAMLAAVFISGNTSWLSASSMLAAALTACAAVRVMATHSGAEFGLGDVVYLPALVFALMNSLTAFTVFIALSAALALAATVWHRLGNGPAAVPVATLMCAPFIAALSFYGSIL